MIWIKILSLGGKMRNDLEKKILEYCPLLYFDYHADKMQTCMCWGFECRDGWFDLILRGSLKLEELIRDFVKNYPDCEYYPKASQVKEKYGTLRFYMTYETYEMSEVIKEMEKESKITCEKCGKPGKIRGLGWFETLCDECHNGIGEDPWIS
jgi:hypothetical protein